ncbi:hypothetical protein Avbf_05237 [Armadillidium vulgare]|nr:hypothetical protein Avbf_05237 [Armadillidium vulgare]
MSLTFQNLNSKNSKFSRPIFGMWCSFSQNEIITILSGKKIRKETLKYKISIGHRKNSIKRSKNKSLTVVRSYLYQLQVKGHKHFKHRITSIPIYQGPISKCGNHFHKIRL